MRVSPRSGLLGTIALCLSAYLALGAGFATGKPPLGGWLAARNPDAICRGTTECAQHSTERGKSSCMTAAADPDARFARRSEQAWACPL